MPAHYQFPRRHLVGFALDFLRGRPRPFHRDSRLVLEANPYPRRVDGLDLVPAQGPFVLTLNHHNRRGLRPYHCSMAISDALARRRPDDPYVAWVITSQLVGQHFGPLPLATPLTRWAIARAARICGCVLMPPPSAHPTERAAAVRRVLRLVRRHPVGLAPEGGGSGVLTTPPPGAGLLLLRLAASAPVLPVAVWEADDTLHIRFGPPYALAAPTGLPREEQDRLASRRVMTAIARLLPPAFQGEYEGAPEIRGP